MVKTTLYLPDDLKRDLERIARLRGISEAELYRRALASEVARGGRVRPQFPLLPSRQGPGTSNDASRVDELLAETGFGEC